MSADQYNRDFDLIRQELDEKQQLRKQRITDEVMKFVLKLSEQKKVQRTIDILSPEMRREFWRQAIRKRFPNLEEDLRS